MAVVAAACLGLGLLFAGEALADTVAVVTASPASSDAVRYLTTQIDSPVVRRTTPNARHLSALVGEARASWPEDLVVVVDTERGVVSVVRPSDGTMSSRALSPSATSAPYAVALAAVELLEIVRGAPQARAAALAEPRPPALSTRWSLEAGVLQSVSLGGDVGMLRPTAGLDVELSRGASPLWCAFGLHATGLVGIDRSQILVLPSGADGRSSIEYRRDELSARVKLGHRQGRSAVAAWSDVGLAFIRMDARDSPDDLVTEDRRRAFWLGLGGELRYTLVHGFALGIGAGAAWFPVTSRYFASPADIRPRVPALVEGAVEFRAQAFLAWESPL